MVSISLGSGFLGTLTIVFVVFKLLGYIDWSWGMVFLPVIIATILGIALVVGIIIMAIIGGNQ